MALQHGVPCLRCNGAMRPEAGLELEHVEEEPVVLRQHVTDAVRVVRRGGLGRQHRRERNLPCGWCDVMRA